MSQEIKITIVTVCYNAAGMIEKTIRSVVAQTYNNIEYLIVDGMSTDDTVNIIRKYGQKNECIRIISEHDKGIYDAMNKGACKSSGQYVMYLNAGDEFADERVLEAVAEYIKECRNGGKRCDILYGDFYDGMFDKSRLISYGRQVMNDTYMLMSNTVCHQAILAGRDYLIMHPFDISYKYVADRKWLSECIRSGAQFVYIHRPLVIYDRGGVSTVQENRQELRNEVDRYIAQMYPVRGRIINFFKKNRMLRAMARRMKESGK